MQVQNYYHCAECSRRILVRSRSLSPRASPEAKPFRRPVIRSAERAVSTVSCCWVVRTPVTLSPRGLPSSPTTLWPSRTCTVGLPTRPVEWADVWSAQCDDDCPHCGARHMSPYKSGVPGTRNVRRVCSRSCLPGSTDADQEGHLRSRKATVGYIKW
jgi:hypothetical protein